MTARLIHLLRHGAPETPGLLLGRTDAAPDPARVAACLARVADLPLAAVVASDLQRARAAGEAICSQRALPLTIDPRWRELDFGAWDGLSPRNIEPAALDAFYADPDASPPPGGERWSALVRRVGSALEDLPEGDILVVTHGGAMRAALACLCGFDHRQGWAFDLPYAALLSLHVWPEGQGAQIVGLRT